MDTQEKKYAFPGGKNDNPELVKEFNERMEIILGKKMTRQELHAVVEKLKKELKEKYNTQKK